MTDPNESTGPTPVCVIVGAGEGLGRALAEKFSSDGYRTALVGRNADLLAELSASILDATPYFADVTDEGVIRHTLDQIADELGPISSLIYTIGKIVRGDVLSVTPEQFGTALQQNVMGAFFCAQQVLPAMMRQGCGSIVFIGATASTRASGEHGAFSVAKAAQYALAASLAKAYASSGVHVSHMVVDGIIEQDRSRKRFPGRSVEQFCAPEDIAETALHLVKQSKRAWTFAVDIRTSHEAW